MNSKPFEHNARFFSEVLAASDDCVKIIGLDGSLQFMSEGGQRVMEVEDFDALKGCPWPDFWQGPGNTEAIAAIEAARSGRSTRFVGQADTAKGNPRYWDVKVSPILDDKGQVESILSISRDITKVRQIEDQQALLRNELSHRIKNIIALVQAVANQTLRDDDAMSVAKPALLARLAALGRAHDLLMQKTHASASLHAVCETAADEYPGRIHVDGPHVSLASRGALAMALSLHELSTNAVKYGALSNDHGQIDLTWSIDRADADDGETVTLSWIERDGPAVMAPTHKGFGSRMIEKALAGYVNGRVEAHYLPSGFVFRMHASIDQLAYD